MAPIGLADFAGSPMASAPKREEKRFAWDDMDQNGAVAREEYLVARRKSFANLDLNLNLDGKLGFEEYAVKAFARFAAADQDRKGTLNAAEFALTRVVRKSALKYACRPLRRTLSAAPVEEPPEDEQPIRPDRRARAPHTSACGRLFSICPSG